jgi:rare lipoprotein A
MEPVQQIEISPQVQPIPPASPIQQPTVSIQPAPEQAAPEQAAPVQPQAPAPQAAPVPRQTSPVPAAAPQAAVVRPAIPPAGTGKTYRIQAGSYRTPRNAVDAFDRIKSTGLSPAYERNGEYYRVVLPALRPEEVPGIAEKLGAAGFREVIIREE